MSKLNSKKLKITAIVGFAVIVGIISGFLFVRATPDFVSDTFTDETKIGKGTEKVEIATSAGQVKLAECYSPNPDWYWSTTTIVRDISNIAGNTATTTKTIYCDDDNCILWEYGEPAPGTVCIATDLNVYANLLWRKTDITTGTRTWGNTTHNTNSTLISGDDIGDTHETGTKVGAGSGATVGGKNWLERYYASPVSYFPAMDRCKELGSGWRLPNILELDSIRDQAKGATPYSRLPNISSAYYWSSSENSVSNAYYLNFNGGSVYYGSKSSNYPLRCVRAW